MATRMTSKIGPISLLEKNPRSISNVALDGLATSLEQDIDMMAVRGIVVWKVPEKLTPDTEATFGGQKGKVVVLGGNQRYRALQKLGYDRIPDEWLVEAKYKDGRWWEPDMAARFILKDNNPEGLSGESDYDIMMKNFTKEMMQDSGIDFSNFIKDDDEAQEEFFDDARGDTEKEIEAGEHGERDEALETFVKHRESSRKDIGELMDTGFQLGLIFESHGQMKEFLEKAGFEDKVLYGMFMDGRIVAERLGVGLTTSGLHFGDRRIDSQLAAMAQENPEEDAERVKAEAEKFEEAFQKVRDERSKLGMLKVKDGGKETTTDEELEDVPE